MSAAPTAPPTDIKLPSAPVANACPVLGNHFATTPVQMGNRPPCETPFTTRIARTFTKPPSAVAAVAMDHTMANAGNARRAPNRCPTHAPGIWQTEYEMKNALISQPDCSFVRPRSPRTVLSATAMALRLT